MIDDNAPSEADLAHLLERVAELDTEYERAKADAEGRVSSWRWFRSNAFDLRPFYFEREGSKPARPLRRRPARLRNAVEYGFARSGDVVVERDHMLDSGDGCYETFRLRDEPVVELVRFDYHHDMKNVVSVMHLKYGDGLLRWCALCGVESGWSESYVWRGAQLSRIDVARFDLPDLHLDVVGQYSFFYEGERLREVRYHHPGDPDGPDAERYRLW